LGRQRAFEAKHSRPRRVSQNPSIFGLKSPLQNSINATARVAAEVAEN